LASNNKLSTEDIPGGTITLSNIGAIGGKFGSPVLNLPEVAIIAIGRIQRLPRFADDGSVYPASITNVSCPTWCYCHAIKFLHKHTCTTFMQVQLRTKIHGSPFYETILKPKLVS